MKTFLNTFMRSAFMLTCLFLLGHPLFAGKIIVSNADQLEDAVENAQAGDTVEVLNGVYNTDGSMTMYNSGTAEAPIVIRAKERQMAELTGDTYFNLRQCAYVVIEGFLFTSTDKTVVKLEACNNIRVTRNVFRLNETTSRKWVIIQGIWNDPNAQSHHNRIDHNLFEEKHMPGNFLTVDGSGDPVYQSSQYDIIEYNHFRNIGPRVENEMEAVRIGWSELSMSSGHTTLRYNLFENCDGDPEIVSVKTSDNLIQYNTFRSSQGTLSLRHGNRTTVEGNFFLGEGKAGTGGIRVYGDDHIIFNNYFSELTGTRWDAPITLTNGDYDGGSSLSKHFRINRAIITYNTLVNNTHNIEIGFNNNGSYSKPPRDVVMANNLVWGKTNELIKEMTAPVNMTWSSNLMYPDSIATLGRTATAGQITVADPLMQYSDSLWQLTDNSAAIGMAINDYPYVATDMQGQPRDANPDVGADEYSNATPLRRPLTAADVGPGAPEIPVGINPLGQEKIIRDLQLLPNYPNPFNPQTTIRFRLNTTGVVTLEIFDISGQRITSLLKERLAVGLHEVTWDASANASGVYFYRLSTAKSLITGKMVLMK